MYVAVKPVPPENCTLGLHTRHFLQVRCQASPLLRGASTYLLQVYDANTRLLLGTATSHTPDAITITSLPKDHESLLLFVRTMTSKSITSDAAILYAPPADEASGLKLGGKMNVANSRLRSQKGLRNLVEVTTLVGFLTPGLEVL